MGNEFDDLSKRMSESMASLQSHLKSITSVEVPDPPIINFPEKSTGQLLNDLKSELIHLQRIQKEKDWVQKHPFWFGTIMAAVGAIFGALKSDRLSLTGKLLLFTN